MIPEGLAQVQGSSDVFGTGDGIVREYWNNRKANKGLAAGGDGGVGYGGWGWGAKASIICHDYQEWLSHLTHSSGRHFSGKGEKQCAG